jgi:hypothetical protein
VVRFEGTDREFPVRALAEVRRLRVVLSQLERALVAQAREKFVSWREIGEALGVTPQAAHKRFRRLDTRSRKRQEDTLFAELTALHKRNPG